MKHSPARVVGWELHPADRVRQDGAERFLHYQPLCILIKFTDATWTVNSQLGVGVWPLYPVERSWILNETSGAKIKRKGFTIVPDFASTAFMIQGSTLEASIADCGDVLDSCGLSELMTNYVILSRVKTAASLLLLRAFGHDLFPDGRSPGTVVLAEYAAAKVQRLQCP